MTFEGLAYCAVCPTLWGITLTGIVTAAEVHQLIAWIEEEHRHRFGPYDAFYDCRAVIGVEGSGFADLARFAERHRPRQRSRTRRGFLLRPAGGIAAALVAGLPSVLAPTIPVELGDTLTSFSRWLGTGHEGAVPAVEAVAAALRGERSLISKLREYLSPPFRQRSLSTAASALAVSTRTLQRKLSHAGTSFEKELAHARVREAQRLLRETPMKISAVAHDAGFMSAAQFSATFRRVVGMTPSEYRRGVLDRDG